jgi:hypothetical protein
MKKTQKARVIKGAEVGGAITAAVLAASAAAYLLSDKKNQAKAKSWAKQARVDIAKKAKVAKKLGKKEYGAIVDQVTKRYGSLEDISARDIMTVAKELKGQWDAIQMHAKKMARPVRKAAKKIVKKSAKKSPARKK